MLMYRILFVTLGSWAIHALFTVGNVQEITPDDAEVRFYVAVICAVIVLIGLFAKKQGLAEYHNDYVAPWLVPGIRACARILRRVLRWLFISLPRAIWQGYQAAPKALVIVGLTISVSTFIILPLGITVFGWELPFATVMIACVVTGMILWIPAAAILISHIGGERSASNLILLPQTTRQSKSPVGGGGDAA